MIEFQVVTLDAAAVEAEAQRVIPDYVRVANFAGVGGSGDKVKVFQRIRLDNGECSNLPEPRSCIRSHKRRNGSTLLLNWVNSASLGNLPNSKS